MIFRNIKGHPDASVAIGVLASRKRVAALLDCEPENLGKMLYHSVEKPVAPVEFQGAPLCQEVVHLADDPDFDLNRLVPAPTKTQARTSRLACVTLPTRIPGCTM